MMHSLVYVSASDRRITGVDLQALLEQSRRHNAANDITGLLLHRSGTFLQFLEGSEEAVERLFASIEVDERHHDVVLVRRRTQPGRQFPNWTMEYGDVDPASTDPVAGTKPWTRGPDPQTAEDADFVRELLDVFDPPVEPRPPAAPVADEQA